MQFSVLVKDMVMWLGAARLPKWCVDIEIPSSIGEKEKCK